ncbi:hypothetical protein Emag_000315 [Eimeria magna]
MRLLFVAGFLCLSEGLTLSKMHSPMTYGAAHSIESKVVDFEDGEGSFGEGTGNLLTGAAAMKDASYSRLVQRDSQCQHGKCQEGEELIPRLRKIATRIHRWHKERKTTFKKAKLVVLMRHAESLANRETKTLKGAMKYTWNYIRGTEWGKRDSPLSWKGVQQCMDASAQLRFIMDLIRQWEKEGGLEPFCVESFVSSPLRRALQTAALTMNGIDAEYHCPAPGEGQASDPQQRPTWLVDPLVSENVNNRSDEGQEVSELQRSLYLLLEEQSLLPAVFDLETVPAGEKWWLPYTVKQLQQLLSGANSQASDVSTTGSDEPRDFDLTDALEDSPAAPPQASESTDNLVVVGDAVPMPPSTAEKSVKETLLQMEKVLQRSSDPAARRADQDSDSSPTVTEDLKVMQARGKVLLKMMCEAKDASTFFVVTHSYFLMGILGLPKFKNAQFKAYALFCDGTPRLEKIDVEDSKPQKLPVWVPLPKFLRGKK